MKRIFSVSLLVLALIALAQSAYPIASPTFSRLTGLIDIPTADIPNDRIFTIGLHGAPDNIEDRGLEWDANLYLSLVERAEFGLTFFEPDEVAANVKFLLLKEEENDLGLAIGVENIGREIPNIYNEEEFEGEENSVYAVLSRRFGILDGLRGHLGVGSGRFVGHGDISEDLRGVFVGIEKEFSLGKENTLSLMAEIDGRDANAGLRYSIPQGMTLDLAVTEIDNLLEKHQDEEIDVTYCLGASWFIPVMGKTRTPKKPVTPIRTRAVFLEEEVVRRGVIEQGLERYLSSENVQINIVRREKAGNQVRFYVQIKNTGKDPIYANPNYFTLINEQGSKFYYSTQTFSQKKPFLGERLWPGTEMEGTLVFAYRGAPRELVYNDGWKNLSSRQIR